MSIQCQHNLPRETCWMCNATTRLANAGITTPTNDDLIKELARQVADLRDQLAAARALLAEAQYFVPSGLLRDRIDATLAGQRREGE